MNWVLSSIILLYLEQLYINHVSISRIPANPTHTCNRECPQPHNKQQIIGRIEEYAT